jgi:hypothetical protein
MTIWAMGESSRPIWVTSAPKLAPAHRTAAAAIAETLCFEIIDASLLD